MGKLAANIRGNCCESVATLSEAHFAVEARCNNNYCHPSWRCHRHVPQSEIR